MANTKFSTSSINQGLVKSRSMLVGNAFYDPTEFESIATVVVGAGGASDITFSSIPGTYAHLQIRGIAKWSDTSDDRQLLKVEFNSDTGNNYARHLIGGNGGSAYLDSVASTTARSGARLISSNASYANIFTAYIFDILDYTDTNKYTTVRILGGFNTKGGSFQEVTLGSFLWQNTAAITNIKLLPGSANLAQYSKFALYGIKD